jgi:hypothetical protein
MDELTAKNVAQAAARVDAAAVGRGVTHDGRVGERYRAGQRRDPAPVPRAAIGQRQAGQADQRVGRV